MAQFTITASNITTNSATIELTSEIAHTAASSVDVTVVSSNGVEAYAGTTTIPVGSIGDVISVPVTGLRSNMEYTVTAKTGTTYTDTGTFTTTDNPTARTATQSQWEDLADKVEAASVAQSTLYDTIYGSNIDGSPTQNAVSAALFNDPTVGTGIKIGSGSLYSNTVIPGTAIQGRLVSANGGGGAVAIGGGNNTATAGPSGVAIGASAGWWTSNNCVSIGANSTTDQNSNGCITIGSYARAGNHSKGCIVLGIEAQYNAGITGVMYIGTNSTQYGYNGNSNYRLITGVYDGQGLHDAATVAQGNTLATAAPTTSTEGVLGQLYTDTTNMHTYQCTAIDTTDPSNPVYTWQQRW